MKSRILNRPCVCKSNEANIIINNATMKKKIATKEKIVEKTKPEKPLIEEEELEEKRPEEPNPEELSDASDDEGFVEDSYEDVSDF